jgi:hypothetical protein
MGTSAAGGVDRMLAFESRDRAGEKDYAPPRQDQSRDSNARQVSNPVWTNLAVSQPALGRDPKPGAPASAEKPAFKACDRKRADAILEAARGAKKLAEVAIGALERPLLLSFQVAALNRNFGPAGDAHQSLITKRYREIRDSLATKQFICKPKCTDKKGHLCAQAPYQGNTIYICPLFGSSGCPPDYTILHEAAHNAGAKDDIDKNGAYPPANAENNAYSYEHFAGDLKKGLPTYELPTKKPAEIVVPQ